ncbi:hypothetical protein M3Y97_00577800 [Aphelenchoides bicaudatus]|nr:hypothetical protein M3Y97_00577800 [Aphelenchoides bicaudatus]
MIRTVCLVLLASSVWAQEETNEGGGSEETVDTSTLRPRSFTFRPEVLRKFRIVLKRIFNFDEIFNTPPNALFSFPQTLPQNIRQSVAEQDTNQQAPPRNPFRPSDRELLEETAEVPDNTQQRVYDQQRRYEQYWQAYYARQQQQSQQQYGSWNQQYSPYGNPNYYYYNQQQQQYSPYSFGTQQQQYSPYYGQQNGGFNIGSGLNVGFPNGLGFNMNSGLGFFNVGK